MAQLKDLIVNGASRLIGDAYVNTIQITKLNAPTSAGGSTYGIGSENQVLLSNGSSIYWGKANISSFTNDAGYITSADVPEGASAYTGTISAVGTTASTGTNNGFARGDHVHNITKTTINSVLGTGSGTTKFYREDGTWATPNYIANTDEKLKIAAVTSGTTYYPIVAANSTAAANRQYDATGFAYVGTNGTTSAVGAAKITLGNSTASGTANNKQGSIVLYGSTAYATTITPGAPSAARTITLPNESGTIALSSNPIIATDSGAATVSLTANTTYKLTAGGGSLIFKTPVDTNTDTKVTQAYSTTNDSYPLLLSATNGVTSTGSRGATTSILNNSFYANPNTGTLSTKNLVITDTSATARIEFSRVGTSISNAPNYIQFPASSRLNFVGGSTRGNDVSMMILESDPTNPSIFPGTKDTVNLGSSSLPWNNIYAKTVTLSQDPVNNLEAATKQYVDNKVGNEAFEIPVLATSGGGWYIPSTIKGTDILNHIDNCYLMIDGYGRTEINNYLIDSASPPGPNIQLFAKAYDDVYYFGTEYTMFKVIAAGNSTNTPTVETIDFTQTMDGDKRVYQNYSTVNASFPLLLTSISGITSTSSRGAYEAILNNNIYANPSTGTITATTFSGALSGNATTATTATKLGTANKGSGTKPIYLAAGVPTECSTYAGGTAVTLNGASKAASTASFYAPTSAGTSGQLLKSNGSGAPGWMTAGIGSSMQPIYLSAGVPTACAIPSNGAWWSAVPQILQDGVMEVGKYIDFHTASNGTTDYDVRITAETTGLTISGTTVGTFSGNLSGTATTATKLGTDTKGSSTKPIYLSSGAPTECSTYAGGTKVTLNGSNKGASTASFYAPTSVGTSGYILKSNGSGAPTWLQTLPVTNGGTGATSAADAPWVQKSGDTMTGYLTYKDPTINAALANNNVSSIQYPTTFNILDSQDRIITRQEGVVTPDGNIAGYWYVRNYNTSGESLGTQGIQIIMNKSGELTTEIRNSKKLTIDKNSCIQRNAISSSWLSGRTNALTYLNTSDGYSTLASIKTTNGTWSIGHYTSWPDNLLWIYLADSRTENNYDTRAYLTSAGEYHASKVWGAVYNDYAEMRNVPEAQIEDNPLRPGICVREVGDGTMIATTERLQRGCKIISDTFGFNIGETDNCKTPIAVSGRALVYLDQDREIARDYIGWPVCSGPNGTVSIMTEEEEEKYPSRIVGTISEIPDYEKWGSSDVEVNGRIWIYVR